jgi:hypothetical protein
MSTVTEVVRNPTQIYYRPKQTFKLLFTDPNEFFARRAERDGLRWEALLLLIGAVICAVGGYITARQAMQGFPGGVGSLANLATDSGATISTRLFQLLYAITIRVAAGLFIIWALYGGVIYALSWLYNGVGKYFQILKLTAWAFVPFLIGNVLYWGAVALSFYFTDVESELSGARATEQLQFLLNQGRNEPWVIAIEVLLIVLIVVTGYFLQYAVAHARDHSLETARKIAAVPVAFHALFMINTLLQHTLWMPEAS